MLMFLSKCDTMQQSGSPHLNSISLVNNNIEIKSSDSISVRKVNSQKEAASKFFYKN